jgi:proteasome lid subunit RPN8/RPN11
VQAPVPEPAFTVESFPVGWSSEVAAAALTHARSCFPNESVGFVEAGRYVPAENTSPQPGEYVQMSMADHLRLENKSTIFVHSHPDGPQCPSERDMRSQRMWGNPFVIVPIEVGGLIGQPFAWGHETEPAPLLGRPFRHGIYDCVTLVRDWYRRHRGVTFTDEPRDWGWWSNGSGQDLYIQCFMREGFTAIHPNDALQEGDVLLYAMRSKVAQHSAVVMADPALIMHHPAAYQEYDPTRRSGIDLRHRWQRFVVGALRLA